MIEIEINCDAVQKLLNQAAEGLQNSAPLMAVVAARMRRAVDDNFNAQGRPAWAGIKRPGTILQDSGRLRNSITEQSDADSAVVGTNLAYAPYHQFGTRAYTIRPKNKKRLYWQGARHPARAVSHPGLKARPFLVLTPADEEDLVESVRDYLATVCGLPPE
ncbi:phage virion morphogenesis protein [Neisseria sp. HSC-16F19]|nr:phage virion morphogenesis protein [Neisseria sp. HSC-16F19]MCP2041772.1 phage virion morphogenesis protein [Neisseria sp. HSC-16F19]